MVARQKSSDICADIYKLIRMGDDPEVAEESGEDSEDIDSLMDKIDKDPKLRKSSSIYNRSISGKKE